MATSFKITDGTTEYELVYNSASQTVYKQKYGAQLQNSQPSVLMHQPDYGSAVPVRGFAPNRQLYLTLHVPEQTAWDDVYNAVTDIARMVDGDDSQALRYWTDGDVNRVSVRIQQDGATNYTDIPVLYGLVDMSNAYTQPVSELNKIAYDLPVALVVAPYGEGAAISLHNDLPSSPHFIEDSDSDGLADGWALYGTGVSSTSIETTSYLVGGKSQEFTTDNTNLAGITLDYPCTGDNTAGYAWVRWVSGDDTISIEIWEVITTGRLVAGTTITYNNGNGAADKTCVDSAGNTWYRVSVTGGVSPPATTCQLRVFRSAGNATEINSILVDACYAEDDASAAPDAWCSTSAIENRHDPDSSNEDQINYLDFWGIPGDSNALARFKSTLGISSGDRERLIWAGWYSGVDNITDVEYSQPNGSTLFATANNGSWTAPSDATRTGGEYLRFTASGGTGDGTSLVSTANRILFKKPLRLFLLCRSSSTAVNISIEVHFVASADTTVYTSEIVNVTNANTWEMKDLGLLNLTGLFPESFPSPGIQTQVIVNIDSVPNGGTFDYDQVDLLPSDFDFGIFEPSEVFANGDVVWLDGIQSVTTTDATGFNDTSLSQENHPHLVSGATETRYTFMLIEDDDGHTLDDTYSITTDIIPRTRHLLGVK